MFDQTEDLENMFDLDDFGENAIFTVPDPTDLPDGTIDVTAIIIYERNEGTSAVYDRSFFDEKFYSVIVETGKDFFIIPTHKLPAGIKRNTVVQFRSGTYYVFRAPYNGGDGVTAIFISKDQA